MSREQDLLFCKIAISTGKVTQDAAQKCLALANRFEAEGKKRPQVGAIFLKQNLLAPEDVQRIYGAVQKRLEVHGGGAATATHAPRKPAPAHPHAPARAAHAARPAAAQAHTATSGGKAVRAVHKASGEEKIDNTTLWLGVVMLVLLLVAVVGILIMLLSGGKKELPPDVTGGMLPRGGAPSASPAPAGTPAPSATPAPAPKEAPKPDPNKELLEKILNTGKKAEAPKDAAAPEGGAPQEKTGIE